MYALLSSGEVPSMFHQQRLGPLAIQNFTNQKWPAFRVTGWILLSSATPDALLSLPGLQGVLFSMSKQFHYDSGRLKKMMDYYYDYVGGPLHDGHERLSQCFSTLVRVVANLIATKDPVLDEPCEIPCPDDLTHIVGSMILRKVFAKFVRDPVRNRGLPLRCLTKHSRWRRALSHRHCAARHRLHIYARRVWSTTSV